MTTLTVPARYNGPATSGNGGIVAGLLAAQFPADATVEVTLRQPPPLDVPMQLTWSGRQLNAIDGDRLIAQAEAVTTELEPVPPAPLGEAERAAGRYDGWTNHPFPTCFVCGTERPERDGFALAAGAIDPDDRTRLAAPFTARADFKLPASVAIWAALDCPGGWAIDLSGRKAVLGRMTARVSDVAHVGEQCVVTAQCDRWDGRKAYSRTSVYGADGRLLGSGAATWIEIAR